MHLFTNSNPQYMFLCVNKWGGKWGNLCGLHRVGVVAFRLNHDESITLAASMVSRSEPHGFNARKGIDKAVARLNNPDPDNTRTVTLKKMEVLNGYPLRIVLKDLNQDTQNNYFHDINWEEHQRKFEHTLATHIAQAIAIEEAIDSTVNYPWRMEEKWDTGFPHVAPSAPNSRVEAVIENQFNRDTIQEAEFSEVRKPAKKVSSKKKSKAKSIKHKAQKSKRSYLKKNYRNKTAKKVTIKSK